MKIDTEKLNSRKFIKAVGALNKREAEDIVMLEVLDKNGNQHEIVDTGILMKSPEKSPWNNDAAAMEEIRDEISSGPFNYIVIFFKE